MYHYLDDFTTIGCSWNLHNLQVVCKLGVLLAAEKQVDPLTTNRVPMYYYHTIWQELCLPDEKLSRG